MRQQFIAGRQQFGLTLLEVIVAALLLSSCVIGIAAIYAQHDKTVRGGKLHARAVARAKEMAGYMRAESDPKISFETVIGATCDAKPKPSNQNATNVVACWQNRVETELTNGSAYIALDRNSIPPQYVITVSWSEPRSGTASYVLRVPAPVAAATTGDVVERR